MMKQVRAVISSVASMIPHMVQKTYAPGLGCTIDGTIDHNGNKMVATEPMTKQHQ
jgi:hypothetical protein